MPLERDPRKDPKPGDLIGKTIHGKRYRREVIQITEPTGQLGHKWVVYRTKGNHNACLLQIWQKWAEGAEVSYVS